MRNGANVVGELRRQLHNAISRVRSSDGKNDMPGSVPAAVPMTDANIVSVRVSSHTQD